MNKRARKKSLKQHGKYVAPKELWNLDCRIAEFVLPRLRKFREVEDGCPGCGEMDTYEKWMAALDKMILAFEYVLDQSDWWIDDPKYDYIDGLHMYSAPIEGSEFECLIIEKEDWVAEIEENHKREERRRQEVIEEGLQLFAKWLQRLWW